MESIRPEARSVSPWARRFVWAYLAVFVVAGLVGIEAWPLTGWRLFADARSAEQRSWQAVTVDAAGREQPIRFADLPVRYQGDVQVLKGYSKLAPGQQAAVCRAWADAVRARGVQVRAVRIYRIEVDVSRRVGRRGTPPRRTLGYTCVNGAVRTSGGAGG